MTDEAIIIEAYKAHDTDPVGEGVVRKAIRLTREDERESKWISVDDRLPSTLKEYVQVLVCDKYGMIGTATFDGYSKTFDATTEHYVHAVTHWMNLPNTPQPPKP